MQRIFVLLLVTWNKLGLWDIPLIELIQKTV